MAVMDEALGCELGLGEGDSGEGDYGVDVEL